MIQRSIKVNQGVTLIETLIGIAILAILAFSIYRGLAALLDILSSSGTRLAATTLANEEIEIIRNMPFQNIGTIGGIPEGILEPLTIRTKDNITFNVTTVIRNIDDPFDGTLGGSPNDLSPADYKLIELTLDCTTCQHPETFQFTGRVAPRALENASDNGALFVQVIDASGLPIQSATVNITNDVITPPVAITDTTDVSGFLKIVDVPPAVQSYHITATKSGYSHDQTYATSSGNPNPLKPDATVALQTVTQVTLVIDRVSTLEMSTVTETCNAVSSVDFDLAGAKLIGAAPDVLKFQQSYTTNTNGVRTISNLEWDTYLIDVTDSLFDLAGTIPNPPLTIMPNSNQDFRMIMQSQNPRALLVTVLDITNQLPIANAVVGLTTDTFQQIKTTGRGFLIQTDWSGGEGQVNFINKDEYFSQDGNIDTTTTPGILQLEEVTPGVYSASGWIISSTFNTGSASNFYNITWEPKVQPLNTGADSAQFQIATATTSTPLTWDYKGPDGTASSFYTIGNSVIHSDHNGDQFIRYKAYLSTASTTYTPNITDVSVTFASDCVPPGQALFNGLALDTYTIDIAVVGYQNYNDVVTVNQNWQEIILQLNPE
jgi:prepilin-type N-terminal cleavage/methylation domain-containing protein